MTISTDCARFRSRLARALEGRPLPEELAALSWHEHLLACAPCRALLEREEALEALLASLPDPRLAPDLRLRVIERLRVARLEGADALDALLELDVADRPPAGWTARLVGQLAAERRLDALLDLDRVEVPAGLAARVVDGVEAAAAPRRPRFALLRGPRALAAAASVAFALLALWALREDPRTGPGPANPVAESALDPDEAELIAFLEREPAAFELLENPLVWSSDSEPELALGVSLGLGDETVIDFEADLDQLMDEDRYRGHSTMRATSILATWTLVLLTCSSMLLSAAVEAEERPTARERWAKMDGEERQQLRERYDAYTAMSTGEQRELTDRARNLRRMRDRLLAGLGDEQRAQLLELGEAERRALLGELLEEKLREQGRRLHAKLPEAWRQELEDATPRERREFFVEFKQRHRPRMSVIAVENLARLLGRDRAEIRRLKRLDEGDRLIAIVELRKELNELEIEAAEHLPAGMTETRWIEIQQMSPEAFFDEVLRIQHERRPRERRDGADPEGAPVAEDAPDVPLQERRRAAARELLGALRPHPDERIALAHLQRPQREEQLSESRRIRIQAILGAHEILPDDQLAEWADLEDREFYGRVRRLVQQTGVDHATPFERRRMRRMRDDRRGPPEGDRDRR